MTTSLASLLEGAIVDATRCEGEPDDGATLGVRNQPGGRPREGR